MEYQRICQFNRAGLLDRFALFIRSHQSVYIFVLLDSRYPLVVLALDFYAVAHLFSELKTKCFSELRFAIKLGYCRVPINVSLDQMMMIPEF